MQHSAHRWKRDSWERKNIEARTFPDEGDPRAAPRSGSASRVIAQTFEDSLSGVGNFKPVNEETGQHQDRYAKTEQS
jgi:hypothetical protein